jgi:predicted nucleotidyltransferase
LGNCYILKTLQTQNTTTKQSYEKQINGYWNVVTWNVRQASPLKDRSLPVVAEWLTDTQTARGKEKNKTVLMFIYCT